MPDLKSATMNSSEGTLIASPRKSCSFATIASGVTLNFENSYQYKIILKRPNNMKINTQMSNVDVGDYNKTYMMPVLFENLMNIMARVITVNKLFV